MKITITGSLGNIGQILTEKLVTKGHLVTVVSHDAKKTDTIKAMNAIPAIGSVEDVGFLAKAFEGADAVYTMIPPNYTVTNLRKYMQTVGEAYAKAIALAGVKYVVNLSSIGSHLPDGPGPTGINHYIENLLNGLEGVNILHLRPGMFYTNFFGAIQPIRYKNMIGHNFEGHIKMVLSHPQDIAEIAFEAFDQLSFTGNSVLYVAGDEKDGNEIATTLGAAIGKPDLTWVAFSDEALLDEMLKNGLSAQMATIYVIEIGKAIRDGLLFEDYHKNKDKAVGQTSLAAFAQQFAAVYQNSGS